MNISRSDIDGDISMTPSNPLKLLTMAIFLTAAVLLTLYFHRVLGIGTVFTHLFYIPIILAALWWNRAGFLIAVALSGLLMVSHWTLRPDPAGPSDYFRAFMFLVVAYVILLLRDRLYKMQSALQKQTSELDYQVRALSCLYGINRLREKAEMTLDDIFRETVKLLQEKGYAGTDACVCITRKGKMDCSRNTLKFAGRFEIPIMADGKHFGDLLVCFCNRDAPEGTQLGSMRELAGTVARRLGKIIEHENAREELDRYRLHLEDLVRERTDELMVVNRRLRQEVDERKRAENFLRESEHQYRILFENASEAIFIAQDDYIRFFNPALTALGGHDCDHLLQTPFPDLIHPDDRKLVSERYKLRLSGNSVPSFYAFRVISSDGTYRWVELNAVTIQWQGKPATLNFLRDLSDRKQIEATIGWIQKMESIGILAGGVAHQFNNALSGITGNIDLLKLSFPDDPTINRYSTAMMKSANTMIHLTGQLLAYARGGKYQPRQQLLSALVHDVLPMVALNGEKKIRIETTLFADPLFVEVDPVQMRTVLLAVIHNSVEAIEKKGKIRIETFLTEIDAVAAQAFMGLPEGSYAGLSIVDDGSGMKEEVRSRIFEPFFTTRFPGRGLGMAAAYGIIKNHDGYIYVDSEPGRGTSVHILLPPCSGIDTESDIALSAVE
jgi:PAS domain S-box-containing protein